MQSHTLMDTPSVRKARGAFFTPPLVTRFIAEWAIQNSTDKVLEPSAGEAEFLVAAVERLQALSTSTSWRPRVDGVEIHKRSAAVGQLRVADAGGDPSITCHDFFDVEPAANYDAVIGNPPYIRYQDFSGSARAKSRQAALRGGVRLNGLASSWAAFTVHSALFLKKGGRLGLVLPAELLSVNYAAPVREFLFQNFSKVQLVLFGEQIFPEAEADVVLLLAEGYGEGPTAHATFREALNPAGLAELGKGLIWRPSSPATKWTASQVSEETLSPMNRVLTEKSFVDLSSWGQTRLGIVTGNNKFFTLTPARAADLGIPLDELRPLSPPGSAHLRGLSLSDDLLNKLGESEKATYLFRPGSKLSPQAAAYVLAGHQAGVDTAYKCRVRRVWYQVPLMPPADLLLTYMNADTARLTTNEAGALHLNSVHGVYLHEKHRDLARDLLPLASLNSLTLLHAEMVGRSYGGGILKIEPREANTWAMPSPELVTSTEDALREVLPLAAATLQRDGLLATAKLVDQVLFRATGLMNDQELSNVREARFRMSQRRTVRGSSG